MNKPLVKLDLAALELSIGTFTDGKPTDPYRAEAAKIFCVKEEDVTPEQRQYAKVTAMRLLYTQGVRL